MLPNIIAGYINLIKLIDAQFRVVKKNSLLVSNRNNILRDINIGFRKKKNEDEGIGSDISTEEESETPEKEILCPKIYKCPYEDCEYSDCLINNVRAHYGRKHLGKSKDNISVKVDKETEKKYYKCNHCGIEKNYPSSIYYHLSACQGPYSEKYVIKRNRNKNENSCNIDRVA